MMNYYTNKLRKQSALIGCAIAMFAMTACSTDDNPTDNSGRALIQLNTDFLYNELKIPNSASSLLQNDDIKLVGAVLIYDEEGYLVKEMTDTIDNLAPITFDAGRLTNGTYTFVAFQHIFDNYQLWELQDKDQLSTVKIFKDRKRVLYYRALGVVSQTVTIDGSIGLVEMTPKAAGTMIDVHVNRTENLNNDISLSIQKQGIGIYLDPALSDAERIEYAPEVNLSSTYLYPNESYYPYFVLTEGNMNSILFHWHPEENLYWSVWWNQPISLKPGTRISYYYDDTPQLFYKTYVGPYDDFDAWYQDSREHLYALKPLVPYGATKEEAMQYMAESGVYNYLKEIGTIDGSPAMWYPLDPTSKFNLFVLVNEEKGVYCNVFTYNKDDIPLSLVEDEIIKMGYVFSKEEVSENATKRFYISPDGNEEVLLYQDDVEWDVFFNDPTREPKKEETKTRRSSTDFSHLFMHQSSEEKAVPFSSVISHEPEMDYRLPFLKNN